MGIMQFQKELGASHEPGPVLSLELDLELNLACGEDSTRKAPRFKGIVQFKKELGASHEPIDGREVDG
jgi:hypothetical protein